MSPVDINVPTTGALVLVKKGSFVSVLTNLNNRNNVCKQWYLLFQFYNSSLFPTASLFPGPLNLRDGRKTNPGNEVVFHSVFGAARPSLLRSHCLTRHATLPPPPPQDTRGRALRDET